MGALLPLRATVYAIVWATVLPLVYRLLVGDPLSWRSFVPSSYGLLIGFLSGFLFAWLRGRCHWLLAALGIALFQAELAAWVGSYGPVLRLLLPPTFLAALLAAFAAHRLREPENDLQIELCKLFTASPLLLFLIPGCFGDYASAFNTISTHHRVTSPDTVWVARVKRGGPLLGDASDTVVARLNRDWGGLFTVRLGEYPLRSITRLHWSDPATVSACVVDGPTLLWVPLHSNALPKSPTTVAVK